MRDEWIFYCYVPFHRLIFSPSNWQWLKSIEWKAIQFKNFSHYSKGWRKLSIKFAMAYIFLLIHSNSYNFPNANLYYYLAYLWLYGTKTATAVIIAQSTILKLGVIVKIMCVYAWKGNQNFSQCSVGLTVRRALLPIIFGGPFDVDKIKNHIQKKKSCRENISSKSQSCE